MQNIFLVVHLLACLALIVTILLQRSEGGALGIGGGGGLMSGRSATDGLARATMLLAAVFFATSLGLSALNAMSARAPSEVERVILDTESAPPLQEEVPAPELFLEGQEKTQEEQSPEPSSP